MKPIKNSHDPSEQLSDKLLRLRERTIGPPPAGYFEELERSVFAKVKGGHPGRIYILRKFGWIKAAIVVLVLATCIWLYVNRTEQPEVVEWVFTEEELEEFLDNYVEDLDRADIYATARDEQDLYLYLIESPIENDAIDFIIRNEDELESLLIDED